MIEPNYIISTTGQNPFKFNVLRMKKTDYYEIYI